MGLDASTIKPASTKAKEIATLNDVESAITTVTTSSNNAIINNQKTEIITSNLENGS